MPVETVDGIVLLGWMEENEAVAYLSEQCLFDPQIAEAEARAYWRKYRDAVETLSGRLVEIPKRQEMSKAEADAARSFRQRHCTSANILDVVKVDPYELIVHQLNVATGLSDGYAAGLGGKRGWVEECLLAERSPNVTYRMDNEGFHLDLPHNEFAFQANPQNGTFGLAQHARFVSVCEFEGRMLLVAGYHRSFAFVRTARTENALDAMARSIVVALTTDVPARLSQASPKTGLYATLTGNRPPLFGDFFDDSVCMKVKLRKKRYEIRVQTLALDIET